MATSSANNRGWLAELVVLIGSPAPSVVWRFPMSPKAIRSVTVV
jgi:hypothetical protein